MRQQRRRRRRDSVRETFLADAKTSSKRQFCRRRVRFEKIIFLSFGHSDSGKKQQLSDLGSWASRRPQRTQNSTGINSDSERRWTENARRKTCDKENLRERERERGNGKWESARSKMWTGWENVVTRMRWLEFESQMRIVQRIEREWESIGRLIDQEQWRRKRER